MEKHPRVLLYGRSVILGSIGASLEHNSELEILKMASPLPDARELCSLAPDVILYDIKTSRPEAAFPLLETCPDLLLIGIDPETHKALVWSGRQAEASEASDLISVIHQKNSKFTEETTSQAQGKEES